MNLYFSLWKLFATGLKDKESHFLWEKWDFPSVMALTTRFTTFQLWYYLSFKVRPHVKPSHPDKKNQEYF